MTHDKITNPPGPIIDKDRCCLKCDWVTDGQRDWVCVSPDLAPLYSIQHPSSLHWKACWTFFVFELQPKKVSLRCNSHYKKWHHIRPICILIIFNHMWREVLKPKDMSGYCRKFIFTLVFIEVFSAYIYIFFKSLQGQKIVC